MNTLDQLLAAGAENCHPLFVAAVGGRKEVVAREVDGTVYLTDAGKEFLAVAPAKPERKSRARKDAAAEPALDVPPDFDPED